MRATPPTINEEKANVKQNETKELVVRSTYSQNLKCNVKNTCNFHLVLCKQTCGSNLSQPNDVLYTIPNSFRNLHFPRHVQKICPNPMPFWLPSTIALFEKETTEQTFLPMLTPNRSLHITMVFSRSSNPVISLSQSCSTVLTPVPSLLTHLLSLQSITNSTSLYITIRSPFLRFFKKYL